MAKETIFIPPIPSQIPALRARKGPAVQRLIADAEPFLSSAPPSVTHKKGTPPSGDKRDYMSLGTYWWPNPDTPDGLPYVRRDGHRNPETNDWDIASIGDMQEGVLALTLAYAVTGRQDFARQAAAYLRTWFLDETTRMNPHLEYGQAIPGHNTGRGIGIIDTRHFVGLIHAAPLLRDSGFWSNEDAAGLRDWFSAYTNWLLTSDHGRKEAGEHNNHGVWYDVQVVWFALGIDKPEIARAILEKVAERRLYPQIAPDGSMPHELARTLSVNYTLMNLNGFTLLAEAGARLDINLWKATGPEGQTLRKALEWLVPYTYDPTPWKWEQIKPANWAAAAYPLYLGAHAYLARPLAEAARASLGKDAESSRVNFYV
jgi:hypothetical protein